MRKRSRVLATALLTVILILAVAMGVSAATGTKSISAIFRNIKIVSDDKVIQTESEPFIVNGRTFVPLRAISEALGAWVDWNQATSTVTIKSGSPAEVEALKVQLIQKDLKIAELEAQLEGKGSKSDGKLTDLESDLLKDYDELRDVEIDDIRLSGDADKVTVNIDVDLYDYDDEWEDLTDSQIKNWVSKVVGEIQDFYDDDTYVTGKIIDDDSGDTLVNFSKDGTKSLSISYRDSKYRGSGSSGKIGDLEDDLFSDYRRLEGVRLSDIALSGSKSKVTVDIEVDLGFYYKEWESLKDRDIEDWLQDICDEIQDFYNDDTEVVGEIIDIDSDDLLVEFNKKGTSRLRVYYEDSSYR